MSASADGDPSFPAGEARVAPISPREWPAEMRGAMAALTPPHPRHPLPVRQAREGLPKALNLLGTLAHHPELATAYHTFNGHLLFATTLSTRQRELVVLRVGWVRGAEYEWLQHAVIAGDVGISNEEISQIAAGADAPGWEPLEAAMLRAVDELIADAEISAATWSVLTEQLDTQQVLDLIFTVGAYDVLAMAMKSCGLQLDDDLRKWHSLFGIAVISSARPNGEEPSDGPLHEAR
jgi:alkylhydroperoxidase family enzyme